MKTILRFLVCLVVFAALHTCAFAQSSSSKGTEFWTAYMAHVNGVTGNSPSQMSLYITSDVSTTGTVSLADGSSTQSFNVTANQVTTIDIPASAFLGTEATFTKGIHITAVKPVAVYAHIYANSVSGATLLLPVNTMGKTYYSLNYTQVSNAATAASVFNVIATEDNTTVEITPRAALSSGKPANVPFTITLNKGQVFQGLSATDLTGTLIKSISANGAACKKIAVFSGSSKIAIGCANNNSSSDNLFQQVYPTASWGKNYITSPLKSRPYDIYRIVLSEPNTIVKLNGTVIPASQFVNNLYYEFPSTVTNSVTADKPIQVIQYAVTQGKTLNCTGTTAGDVGDPEMIYITPIEQSISNVTLNSTNKFLITKNFINVIIPTTAVASFKLDGAATAASFSVVPGNTQYSYAQLPVTSGSHNIQADEGFNAVAYGFGTTESYGYAAGTNLVNLNEYIALQDPVTFAELTTGCKGASYKLQLTLPYKTPEIKWDFKGAATNITQPNPQETKTVQKGNLTLYIYECPTTVTYPAAGSYSIVATSLNPTADDCGSYEDTQFDFDVSELPVAEFDAPTTACPGAELTFTDKTNQNGVSIKSWAWDFGDAANSLTPNINTANTQNAKHIYTKAGDYTITLVTVNANGCSSTKTKTIHINKLPQAQFSVAAPNCETRVIAFTDKTIAGDGSNTKWDWNFGDATNADTGNPNTSTLQNPQHTFKVAGTYKVSLTVTSSTGCISDVYTQDIIVRATPIVDFSLPDACIFDISVFSNNTSISDGSAAQLTYLWNFGDPASGAANTSASKNGQHKYNNAGSYQVTLTVTSASNCITSKTQTFTVNGGTPVARFTVQNESNLCSKNDVIFVDASSVDFGKITQLDWYYDFDNNPTAVVTIDKDDIAANTARTYAHNYGPSTSNRTFKVRLIAHSGASCSAVFTYNITVKPSPIVSIATVAPLCQEDSPLQISAVANNGVNGQSTFSGTAVSAGGLFNPASAGPGSYVINYTFTAANQCDYVTTIPILVRATPKPNILSTFYVLQGGEVKLDASASTGVGPLSYKWTLRNGNTATGLNADNLVAPMASPNEDITYMFTVTSAQGCSKSVYVDVKVLKAPVVPNTFTPNGDGYNDRWEVKYLESYPNCNIDIYNRFGERVYSSIGYPTPWDGTFRGNVLPVGTYYYIINPRNGRKVISGSVTIIR